MITRILLAALTLTGLSACASTAEPRPSRLMSEPDAQASKEIAALVRAAMGRDDLDMEPARLFYNSELVVRPVAVSGLSDRVPGTPTRFILMKDEGSCYLRERGGDMRIDLPDTACR